MKKLLFIFLIIPFLSFNTSKVDIIGQWSGEDKGQIGTFTFMKDGYATVELNGVIMGGKSFDMNGEKTSLTYVYKPNKTPIEIDLKLTNIKSKKVVKNMYLIAEFKDQNTMKLAASFSDDIRPKQFDSNNTIILNRIK